MNNIIAKDFKPKIKGKSDLFSWNLYLWLRRHPDFTKVFIGTWNPATGFDPDNKPLYIGSIFDGWFHGKRLREVVNGYKDAFAYGPSHGVSNWVDISYAFWDRYRSIGVCSIHDYGHNWVYESGSLRECSYCGKQEQKHEKTIIQEVWV